MDALGATLAAAADPTRRSILRRLAGGPASVSEIARPFRMSQQAVSKHLALLERARLIEKRRRGRTRICVLRPEPLRELAEWVEGYRKFWETRFRNLDALLAEMKRKRKGG